mgnify:CR=1 FL=1
MAKQPVSSKVEPPIASDQPRPGLAGAVFDSHEATFTGEYVTLTVDQSKARKRRGQWIALGLFSFCILIFLITMTRMGQNLMVGGP